MVRNCYINEQPELSKIQFIEDKIRFSLKDGRLFIVPLSAFPSIQEIPEYERENYFFPKPNEFSWRYSNKVYNLEQIMGSYKVYNHESDYSYNPKLLDYIEEKGEGFFYSLPVFKEIKFETENEIEIELEDGRKIIVPLDGFPAIKCISLEQRKEYTITDNCIEWGEEYDTFLPEQFLGCYFLNVFYDRVPELKEVETVREKLKVSLKDGRIFIVPLSAFPSIREIPENERKNYFFPKPNEFS